jgi:hypothetical protein
LLASLSDLLARRQLDNEGVLAAEKKDALVQTQHAKYADSFLDKLRTFFQL